MHLRYASKDEWLAAAAVAATVVIAGTAAVVAAVPVPARSAAAEEQDDNKDDDPGVPWAKAIHTVASFLGLHPHSMARRENVLPFFHFHRIGEFSGA